MNRFSGDASGHRGPLFWLGFLVTIGLAAVVWTPQPVWGQAAPSSAPTDVAALVEQLKSDPRGPFQGIRWFCPDGTVRPAQERCDRPGGHQHGLIKQEVLRLQHAQHIFLDPVLTGTSVEVFWDADRQHSRLKQYLLQTYFGAVDDGWVMRRAQYYRGALQAEDEAAWSRDFLTWVLQSDERLTEHYYLVREAVRGLPLQAGSDLQQRIRGLSKDISEAYSPFLDVRIKIHGQPDSTDLARVQQFRQQHTGKAPSTVATRLQTLEDLLRQAYAVSPVEQVRRIVQDVAPTSALAERVRAYLEEVEGHETRTFVTRSSAFLWELRTQLPALASGEDRLAVLRVSVAVEDGILRTAGQWTPATLGELTEKVYALGQAAAGAGLLEIWEWNRIEEPLRPPAERDLSLSDFQRRVQRTRRAADWAAGMVLSTYRSVVDTYEEFEPLARGFLDDRIRGSVLLSLGDAAGALAGAYADEAGVRSHLLGLAGGQRAHGLNPGVAVGTLEVVTGDPGDVRVIPERIYVFRQPPPDLKPVAGIATGTEGNLVSHVQLLARNLAIPNATVPPALIEALRRFDGERVFYAVSPGGTVVMKRAREMTEQERRLAERHDTGPERFRVPTERIDLQVRHLLPLDSVRAVDSGRICGPKAAKMGELKRLFPGRVTDGLVIPFGVFRAHMDQAMPGTDGSHWDFLQATFQEVRRRREAGVPLGSTDAFVFERLEQLREAVRTMPLRAEFVAELHQSFPVVFDAALGRVPVFVRSDTNMEDLKDFTGAGLNLTVPNVVGETALLDAVRRVWASAYSERSYQWRQRLLTNPEDVYPSILLLRSVNVEASGVLLTTGLTAGGPDDVTVAFNRGVGGAVDGQAAETWLLRTDGSEELLAPAREPTYRTLPDHGGVETQLTSFVAPILSARRRAVLRTVAADLRARLPGASGVDTEGPFDVELGFVGDRLWLFQVRPFVENKELRSAEYLRSLDTVVRPNARVSLTAPLEP